MMPVAKKYINILSSGEDSVQRKKSPIEQMSFILSVGLSPAFPGLALVRLLGCIRRCVASFCVYVVLEDVFDLSWSDLIWF